LFILLKVELILLNLIEVKKY